MKSGDLLVENLGQFVDLSLLVFVGVLVLPQIDLSQSLVGERAGHDERWMSGGASQVHKSTLSEDDNTVAIWELESVNLRLDLNLLDSWVGLKTSHVNFIIEVTDVGNNSVVLRLGHVLLHDDILVASGGDEDISGTDDLGELLDLESLHSSLKGANWIDLSNNNSGSARLEGESASLTNITISANNGFFTGNHNIGGSHETIWERVLASINVIELLLGDGVINVDGSEEELALSGHLVQSSNTSGGLLGNTNKSLGHLGPFLGEAGLESVSEDSEDLLELFVIGAGWVWELTGLGEVSLGLDTFVDEEGSITTIIDENIWTIAVWPRKHSVGAIPVLLEGLSLPGEDVGGLSLNDGSGGVILGGEDVARSPSDLSTEGLEGLDEDTGLDGHVEGSGDLGSLEDLLWSVLGSDAHETWHLNLSEGKLLSSEVGLLWESNIRLVLGLFHL